MPVRRRLRAGLLLALLLAVPAGAYECDQYTGRDAPLRDSLAPLDALVEQGLAQVVAAWRGPRDDLRFARKVYWALGGFHWVDKVERYAMDSPDIDRLPRGRTIYTHAPMFAGRVLFFFGVGETLEVGGVRIGSDKIGHFFSQGFKYFRRERHGWTERRFIGWASRVEALIFGEFTTGVFSNADLVANYEGLLFYRSLFEDGAIPGKKAIIRFENGRAWQERPFTWADHVNDFWDEALNPSYLGKQLQRHVARRLPELCPLYRQDPGRWVAKGEEGLERRYAHIGMKDARFNRLDQVCAGTAPVAATP